MALSYTFPLSPFPLIHSSFHFPFMIFLAPVSEVSPPQSDPEFYSVTSRAAGARAGRRTGKKTWLLFSKDGALKAEIKPPFCLSGSAPPNPGHAGAEWQPLEQDSTSEPRNAPTRISWGPWHPLLSLCPSFLPLVLHSFTPMSLSTLPPAKPSTRFNPLLFLKLLHGL